MLDLRRRQFITLLGGATAWPLAARAQQRVTSPRRIGVLLVGWSSESKEAKQFRLGLRDAGYSEGRDVVIEWRSANGNYDRVPALVADLVQRRRYCDRAFLQVAGQPNAGNRLVYPNLGIR
jgi:putative tryptophan/tyrosine transport system substrate-binding protein